MNKSNFIIVKDAGDDTTLQYWDVKLNQWIDDFHQASTFDKEILAVTMPEGCTHIMEFNEDMSMQLSCFTKETSFIQEI